MGCCGGSCSCGKNEPDLAEERRHLVEVPAGGMMLPAFDWSTGPDHMSIEVPIVQVRFKNNRKAYYRNVGGLELAKNDRIVVEDADGHDLGTVSLSGKAASKKCNPGVNGESRLNRVIRKASVKDLQKWLDAKKVEYTFLQEARKIAMREGMELKINDVENRADGKKLNIYYASKRAMDASRLAHPFEKKLRVKVEMCRAGSLLGDEHFEDSFNHSVRATQASYS